MGTSLVIDRRAIEGARERIAGKESGTDAGQALAHKFLVAVQTLAAAYGNRAGNRGRLHQADGSQGQGTGGELADQGQVKEGQSGEGRQRAGQIADDLYPICVQPQECDRAGPNHHHHQGGRQFGTIAFEQDQNHNGCHAQDQAGEVGEGQGLDQIPKICKDIAACLRADSKQIGQLTHCDQYPSPRRKAHNHRIRDKVGQDAQTGHPHPQPKQAHHQRHQPGGGDVFRRPHKKEGRKHREDQERRRVGGACVQMI